MAKQNYTVARVQTRTKDNIGKYERHNERKNEHYANINVDLSRTEMNVHYKSCGNLTYNETLYKLVADGKVSLRGLKADAKVYDEMILDVNTDYFEKRGGYEFAKQFNESAYRFAVKIYGEANIFSAVMHADELNIALTEKYGRPIYHYHLHVVALPVVEKQIKWTKRCKDKSLIGTVKETVMQVSHSKKWKSPQLTDENGVPQFDVKGKPILIPTYSILQDEFFEYMQSQGFTDFIRGARGSTAEHQSVLQYQLSKDKELLPYTADSHVMTEPTMIVTLSSTKRNYCRNMQRSTGSVIHVIMWMTAIRVQTSIDQAFKNCLRILIWVMYR